MTAKRRPTVFSWWTPGWLPRRRRASPSPAVPTKQATFSSPEHDRQLLTLIQVENETPTKHLLRTHSSPAAVFHKSASPVEPDLATHSAAATDFRSFIEQDVLHLARVICKHTGGTERRRVAWMTSELCRVLCTGRLSIEDDLALTTVTDEIELLAIAARRRMDQLLVRGQRAGGTAQFDFTAGSSASINDRQQPWSMCDPEAPVAFVVIPAYHIGSHYLSQQVVYTAW
jgi:hypothetical protein